MANKQHFTHFIISICYLVGTGILIYRFFSNGELYFRNLLFVLALSCGIITGSLFDYLYVYKPKQGKNLVGYMKTFSFWKMLLIALIVVTGFFWDTTTKTFPA